MSGEGGTTESPTTAYGVPASESRGQTVLHVPRERLAEFVMELRDEHGFSGAEVDRVTVAGTERMATINNIANPTDIMMAQYSIPFCVALALFRDPRDPASFDDSALSDTGIRAMCARVTIEVANPPTKVAGASIVTIHLKNGRSFTKEGEEFSGTPARTLNRAELREKFRTMTRTHYGSDASGLFDRLNNLENERELGWVGV